MVAIKAIQPRLPCDPNQSVAARLMTCLALTVPYGCRREVVVVMYLAVTMRERFKRLISNQAITPTFSDGPVSSKVDLRDGGLCRQ